MQQRGPVLQVTISVEESIAKALALQGTPIPPSESGLAMFDTGASTTCIDDALAIRLGLAPIDVVSMCSASHESTQANVYPVQLHIPGFMNVNVPRAIGANMNPQGIVALIGRDFLKNCTLHYNGPMGQLTIGI